MRPPFSARIRLVYLIACIVVFIIAIPILVLYASGYRLGKNFTIVKTGALSVSADEDARLILNGDSTHELGAFGSGFFIQNLRPGMYEVTVEKSGYQSWHKNIAVYEGIVSESASFLFPEAVKTKDVPATSKGSSGGVSQEYARVARLFDAPITGVRKNATTFYDAIAGDVGIWHKDGVVYAKWLRSKRTIPSAFCLYAVCRTAFPVFTSTSTITHIDFYPSGDNAVIVGTQRGIYVTEIDKTPTHHRYTLYEGGNVDFRIDTEGRVFIRDAETLKEVVFP